MRTISKNDIESPLETFLAKFDISTLGDGDRIAGVNGLFAALCATANIAPPGSGILTKEGKLLEVGCNLAISGISTPDIVKESVLNPLFRLQENHNSHLRHVCASEESSRLDARKKVQTPSPVIGMSEAIFRSYLDGENNPIHSKKSDLLAAISQPAQKLRGESFAQSQVVSQASNSASLLNCLRMAHSGRPFINFPVDDMRGLLANSSLFKAIIDGGSLVEGVPQLQKGHLFIDDSCDLFRRMMRENPDCSTQLLWIHEGDAGEDFSGLRIKPVNRSDLFGVPELQGALAHSFAERVNIHNASPKIYEMDLMRLQFRWVATLRKHEDRLPGITKVARHLLATVCFALCELEEPFCGKFNLIPSVNSLIAFLILFIVRATRERDETLFSARIEEERIMEERVLAKLGMSPLKMRDLYRALGCPAWKTEQTLTSLQKNGQVVQKGNLWLHADWRSHSESVASLPS